MLCMYYQHNTTYTTSHNPSVAIPSSKQQRSKRRQAVWHTVTLVTPAHITGHHHRALPTIDCTPPLPTLHPWSIIHCRGLILMSAATDWHSLTFAKTDRDVNCGTFGNLRPGPSYEWAGCHAFSFFISRIPVQDKLFTILTSLTRTVAELYRAHASEIQLFQKLLPHYKISSWTTATKIKLDWEG